MSIIKRMRKQKAVLWTRSSTSDKYGRFSYDAPIEIKCRWEDVAEEFRDTKGQTVMSRSIVYVDRIVGIGDMLRRGTIDVDETADPRTLPETAFEIQKFDQLPDLRNKNTLLTAFL